MNILKDEFLVESSRVETFGVDR